MSAITSELEQALNHFDPRSAILLEQLVRDALALVQETGRSANGAPLDALGWPVAHFDKYAGCLAGDDWQPPTDPSPEPFSTL